MVLYLATWVLAEFLAVLMFIQALRARVAFIPVGQYATWGAAYPVIIGLLALNAVLGRKNGEPLAVDFALPVFFSVIGIALILAVRAYSRSHESYRRDLTKDSSRQPRPVK